MDRRYYDPAKVKELRIASGITQGDLAKALGVARTSIVRAETTSASYQLLYSLAAYYQVEIGSFLREVPRSKPRN